MPDDIQILGLVGSLRHDSINQRLMRHAIDIAGPIPLYERLKELPPFDSDDEDPGPAVVLDLRARIAAADALLFATPEYNASVPGQLKNAIDWASRPFDTSVLRGKPVAVIGASPSRGGARGAVADAQRILARAGATVLEQSLLVPRAYQRIDDADVRADLASVTATLIAACTKTADAPS